MPDPIRAVFTNDAFDAAFRYADNLCSDPSHAINEVVILVPAMANIKVSTTLGSFLGATRAKALEKGERTTVGGKPARLMTKRTLTHFLPGTLVICPYASKDIMDKVDAAGQVAAVIALPWGEDAVAEWIKSWSPMVDGVRQTQPAELIDDPVVVKAMESLTRRVNPSNPLSHPNDQEHAVRTLKILRRKNHSLDADGIRAWAVAHGWKPDAADELAVLAIKIAGLKTKPTLDRLEVAATTYANWVDAAKK